MRPTVVLAILAFMTVQVRAQETAFEFIRPSGVLVCDPAADPRFDPAAFSARFDTLVEQRLAGTRWRSRKSAERLSPSDHAVLLVPSLTSVRTAQSLQGGTITRHNAIVSGSIAIVDPWSNAVLFSANRLIEAPLETGALPEAEVDRLVKQRFEEAAGRWAEVCLEALRNEAAPFTLEAATVAVPTASKRTKGLWPRGARDGVKAGSILRGEDGRLARVTQANPLFSVITDVAGPENRIPAGTVLRLTVVERPSERPEPLVRLQWPETAVRSLPEEFGAGPSALLDILRFHTAQGSGFRILPLSTGCEGTEAARRFSEQVSRVSGLAESGAMTVHRESLLAYRSGRPDIVVDAGLIDSYHGSRVLATGVEEHLYRATLAAAVFARADADEDGPFLFRSLVVHPEELAVVQMKGVRQVRVSDSWFTVLRNAAVRLSEKLRSELAAQESTGQARTARVAEDGSVRWESAEPASGAPLQWLRKAASLRGPDGAALGDLLESIEPEAGYLTRRTLHSEKLRPGDLLRYVTDGSQGPLVGLRGSLTPASPSALDLAWILRLAAREIALATHTSVFLADGAGHVPGGGRVVEVAVSKVVIGEDRTDIPVTAEWRGRIRTLPDAPPVLKWGLEFKSRQPVVSPAAPLSPPDRSLAFREHVTAALKAFVKQSLDKGIGQYLAGNNNASKEEEGK